jgi:anti-anti-sigma factor
LGHEAAGGLGASGRSPRVSPIVRPGRKDVQTEADQDQEDHERSRSSSQVRRRAGGSGRRGCCGCGRCGRVEPSAEGRSGLEHQPIGGWFTDILGEEVLRRKLRQAKHRSEVDLEQEVHRPQEVERGPQEHRAEAIGAGAPQRFKAPSQRPKQRAVRKASDWRPVSWGVHTSCMELLRLEKDEGSTSIRLIGELDSSNVGHVADRLEEELRGADELTLDISELTFMDSQGLHLLIKLGEVAAERGSAVRLFNCPPQVKRLLDVAVPTGIPGVEIVGTEE